MKTGTPESADDTLETELVGVDANVLDTETETAIAAQVDQDVNALLEQTA